MATETPITDALREAILSAGKSRYRISQESGVAQSTLSKFVNGHEALSLAAMDKLAPVLGLRVVLVSQPEKRKPKKRSE